MWTVSGPVAAAAVAIKMSVMKTADARENGSVHSMLGFNLGRICGEKKLVISVPAFAFEIETVLFLQCYFCESRVHDSETSTTRLISRIRESVKSFPPAAKPVKKVRVTQFDSGTRVSNVSPEIFDNRYRPRRL